MSDINNELIRESIYEQVLDEYPKLSEYEQIKIAEKRFEDGVKSASQYILNLADRRLHRLPENHVNYQAKGE